MFEEIKSQLTTKPKKWLVTGAAGFIGSNLVEALLNLNQYVVGLDNFSTGSRLNLMEIERDVGSIKSQKFNFIEGDITNLGTCNIACQGVDYVLHQAALGSVPRSIVEPIAVNKSNVDGFLHMLIAARDAKVSRFVYAASSSAYGDYEGLPKIEEKIGKPLSPYAVSKLVNELYAEVFAKNYAFNSIGLRYFNIFGPRQDPASDYAAVIPKWIMAITKKQPAIIYGDGETSRDFTYVSNVVQANLLAATTIDPNAMNQVYNVAVGEGTSLNQLHLYLKKLIGARLRITGIADPIYHDFRPGDVRHSLACIEKSEKLLAYQPTHSILEGLNETVDWFLMKHKGN